MKQYTVVGVYEDTEQRYAEHFTAENPAKAIEYCLKEAPGLLIAGVFEGKLTPVDAGPNARDRR